MKKKLRKKKIKTEVEIWEPLSDCVMLSIIDSPPELHKCKVLNVGPGIPTYMGTIYPTGIKVGDIVLISRYPHIDLFKGKERIILVRATKILALCKKVKS